MALLKYLVVTQWGNGIRRVIRATDSLEEARAYPTPSQFSRGGRPIGAKPSTFIYQRLEEPSNGQELDSRSDEEQGRPPPRTGGA